MTKVQAMICMLAVTCLPFRAEAQAAPKGSVVISRATLTALGRAKAVKRETPERVVRAASSMILAPAGATPTQSRRGVAKQQRSKAVTPRFHPARVQKAPSPGRD